jgi:NADH dehydrogenase FAD-containing subunit
VILATGQTPNNSLISDLTSSTSESLINPDNGFIRIRPTMQFKDEQYPNLFAVGDIADTGLRKAARPGSAQAAVIAKNIQAMIEGKKPEEVFPRMPAAIHLTLGMVSLLCNSTPTFDGANTDCSRNIMLSSVILMRQKGRLSRRFSRSLSECIASHAIRPKLTVSEVDKRI